MNNSRDILLQILDVIGLREEKELAIDDFLTFAEMEAMLNLIESLPRDQHAGIIDQFISMPDVPRKAEKILGPYFTGEHMREALKQATQKAITQHIVEPHHPRLSPSQRERILALLKKLTYT
jgi:hypothetical protein